jgi:hypothetical protein
MYCDRLQLVYMVGILHQETIASNQQSSDKKCSFTRVSTTKQTLQDGGVCPSRQCATCLSHLFYQNGLDAEVECGANYHLARIQQPPLNLALRVGMSASIVPLPLPDDPLEGAKRITYSWDSKALDVEPLIASSPFFHWRNRSQRRECANERGQVC